MSNMNDFDRLIEEIRSTANQTNGSVRRSAVQTDDYITFYTVVTPIIVVIGLVGNVLCIILLHGQPLRRHRSSIFFISLAAADICNLLFYVLVEWSDKGLAVVLNDPGVRVQERDGLCQVILYVMYSVRLLAAWLLVLTTVERYIGVCRPLLQKRIFTPANGKRIIVAVLLFSLLFPVWKPVLMRIENGRCSQAEGSRDVHFVLDLIYAFLLTILPNSLILLFSIFIARRLLGQRQRVPARCCYNWRRTDTSTASYSSCSVDSRLPTSVGVAKLVGLRRQVGPKRHEVVGAQFALLLVLISSTYLLLSWPYFLNWLLHRVVLARDIQASDLAASLHGPTIGERLRMALHLTRPLMYLTYTVNFFLYSLTGRLFRRQLARMFRNRDRRVPMVQQELQAPRPDPGPLKATAAADRPSHSDRSTSGQRRNGAVRSGEFGSGSGSEGQRRPDNRDRRSTMETQLHAAGRLRAF